MMGTARTALNQHGAGGIVDVQCGVLKKADANQGAPAFADEGVRRNPVAEPLDPQASEAQRGLAAARDQHNGASHRRKPQRGRLIGQEEQRAGEACVDPGVDLQPPLGGGMFQREAN